MAKYNPVNSLMDPDNDDPIIMYDKDNNEKIFDQIAIIPIDGVWYAMLDPLGEEPEEGEEFKEPMVFEIVKGKDEENPDFLKLVEDRDLIDLVFIEYDRLCEIADTGEDPYALDPYKDEVNSAFNFMKGDSEEYDNEEDFDDEYALKELDEDNIYKEDKE